MQNIHDIKRQNTFKIIDAIRFNSGRTKKEIASETGLSFATVSNICRELNEKKLILETHPDKPNSGIGRLPNTVSLNLQEFFGVCIDMHNEGRIVLAITNLRNEIVVKKEITMEKHHQLADIIEMCKTMCMQACDEIGIGKQNLLEVCAASPGVYCNETGLTLGSSIALFEGQPLKSMLKKAFEVPVIVHNDANLSSMAVALNSSNQATKGNNGKAKHLIYIYSSIGFGVGIIVDGKQLLGCEGHAAEISHIPIGNQRLLHDRCGNMGCVEGDLSISGFITKYFDYGEWDRKRIFDHWREFLEAVESKEQKALDVVHENAEIFGKLVSILVNLFDPEIIYIGGSVSVLFEHMKSIIEKEAIRHHESRSYNRVTILRDTNKNTIIYGCAEIIYTRIDFTSL